jgi:hypothetical protein
MFAPKVTKPRTKGANDSTRERAMLVRHPLGRDAVGQALKMPPLFARSAAPGDVRSALSESGHPLDTATLRHFRSSFGHDFSSVRVHTDERAAASAASLPARAYTIGPHVVFRRGEYAPGTTTGRHLLGHELAHVVQQSRGGSAAPGNAVLEAAADHAANQASRGAPVMVAGSSAVGLACKTAFEEFSGGHYSWPILKGALEFGRPVDTIVDDINGLPAAERTQAIDDITQARADRGHKQASLIARRTAQADPKLQAVFDPMLDQNQGVLDRIDLVLRGLAGQKPIPGWNFTPSDFAKLQRAGKDLTIAPDSAWFPAKFQENLLKTLAFVLGPQLSPTATEGVNALDFFHGHLVIKKDPATAKAAKAADAKAHKFDTELQKATTKALGTIHYPKYTLTEKQIGPYEQALEKTEPSLANLLEDTAKVPGAAVMYHTFEFNKPSDLKAKGLPQAPEDPRRHIVTPLDTNTPSRYTPPPGGYEKEYTHIVRFVFLIDDKGAVHVRPLDTSSGFTSLQLSTITGTTFPEPFNFDD